VRGPRSRASLQGKDRLASRTSSVLVALLAIMGAGLVTVAPCAIHLTVGTSTQVISADESWPMHGLPTLAPSGNGTFCGLIAPYGNAIPQPTANDFFGRLCVQSEFQSLVVAWGDLYGYYPYNGSPIAFGAENLTISWGGGEGSIDIDFTINWASSSDCAGYGPLCVHQASWFGNESSGNLSGPDFGTYPLICTCGEQSAIGGSGGLVVAVVTVGVELAIACGVILVARRSGRRPPQHGGSFSNDLTATSERSVVSAPSPPIQPKDPGN
jgi:hypothetical protein